MKLKKLFASLIVLALVSLSFGMYASDNAQAAFIQPLSNNGLLSTFVAYDTAWNDAGSMAIVVGYDSMGGPNNYAYWPNNDTYMAVDNSPYNSQTLTSVDYHRQPIYDLPKVLVVNADYSYDGIVNFYANVLSAVHSAQGVHAEMWQVWNYGTMSINQGKPTAADMAPYDLVIWVPTRDMYGLGGIGDAINIADTQEIAQYLNGGGNFFLSNLAFSNYHGFGSSGYFTYDYLGVMGYAYGDTYKYYVESQPNDSVFDGLYSVSHNWNAYGWLGVPLGTDVLYPNTGVGCFRSWDNFYNMNATSGVRYDGGNFKTVYLGFPLETLNLDFAKKVMQRTLDWIKPPNISSPVSVILNPAKDTSIYSENLHLSNGAGQHLVVGRTWEPYTRRALLQFDLSESIPKYSRIESASLTLHCTYDMPGDFRWVALSTVNSDWGEAGSDAPGDEVYGTSAQTGDATWEYRFYSTDFWSPGGDLGFFINDISVGTSGMDYTWSSPPMNDQIEDWVANPSSNYGWILTGDEGGSGNIKTFASRENPIETQRPRLSITYTTLEPISYQDVFWIAGNKNAGPPATVYKLEPQTEMALIPMNEPTSPAFSTLALDDKGNPLCAGANLAFMHYYDGSTWIQVPDNLGVLNNYGFEAMDFNPNDGRFYVGGSSNLFYTDPVPFTPGTSKCYRVSNYGHGDDISSIAWNHAQNYALVTENIGVYKISSYDHFGNGTLAIDEIFYGVSGELLVDVSWDTDGWNEAAIVGSKGGNRAYWRYYHSNQQLLEGHIGASGLYYTCAFKPPSSPKWLFIPSGSGSIRVNVEEKDQSGEITVSAEFPHIIQLGMWRQSDPGKLSTFSTQVEADSTYTFFVEANYTRAGTDYWGTSLGIYLQGWHDAGLIGTNSNPGDPAWSSATHRTRQFNISYMPSTGTASVIYPGTGLGVSEFALHSYWEDPTTYAGNHHRIYINITLGKQTFAAPGDGAWSTPISWDKNIGLDDMNTWDLKVLAVDTGIPEAFNASYAEFGVQRYAALSVSGNPTGSIPPGGSAILATPTRITYSSNLAYQINVSIPNLLKDGDPTKFIPATSVSVLNDQIDADAFNSDISVWKAFVAANDAWCVWGLDSGIFLPPPSSGTVSAGPIYTDYTAAQILEAFQPTPVYWQVVVFAGTPEGVYRATITITLWS